MKDTLHVSDDSGNPRLPVLSGFGVDFFRVPNLLSRTVMVFLKSYENHFLNIDAFHFVQFIEKRIGFRIGADHFKENDSVAGAIFSGHLMQPDSGLDVTSMFGK